MNTGSAPQPILGKRYQLQQTLGSGGMAVVYQARDLLLERLVAVKVLRPDFSKDIAFRERFRQEARAAANLSHPNIVTVHDFGLDNESLYIVMEHVPGTELKTLIRQRKLFSLAEAIPLIVQACAGIGYAHRAGLVHCDIKPQNILVTPDQRLKVTDFGIARALSTIHSDEHHDLIWGSPQYFSPEQASGSPPSPASDVYSLGVILYEMLTGQLPFSSDDPSELARLHREARPTPPGNLNPDIPLELQKIILKVLAKEPSARYRSADQLGRILTTFSPTSDAIAVDFQTTSSPQPPMPAFQANSPEARSVSTPRDGQLSLDIDWITIFLGMGAALAAGGLIPFWLYVWFSLTSRVSAP